MIILCSCISIDEGKMTKLTLFLVVLSAILFGTLSLAQSLDDSLDQRSLDDDDVEVDETDRRSLASAKAIATSNAGGRLKPVGRSLPVKLTECIVCTDCPKILSNATSKICPYSSDPTKQGKCVVYAEKYRYLKRPWYIRGCATDRGSCADIRQAHSNQDIVKLLSCEECDGDRCNTNGVSRSLPDLTMAFFVLIVTPVLAKTALS